ncbi:hypothetical protein [Marinobacter shengliensis]|uniref:hypothetical protein n=1 Tax=Marinobacter shengliensis TaxID=1389223 RepID=UPI00110912C4|nr:hypothetical protein [Marinobacter shengliensis]
MHRPTHFVTTPMLTAALDTLADHNGLDVCDPVIQSVPTPAWARQVVDAVDGALEGQSGVPEITVMPNVFDYARGEVEKARSNGEKPEYWLELVASTYIQYLDQAETETVRHQFDQEFADLAKRHSLDLKALPTFDEFRKSRQFDHVSSLPNDYQNLCEGIGATDHCIRYPGPNLLGYQPETGEAWFQDYAQEHRGPLEEIERKFYLWAIIETPEFVAQD